MKNDTMTVREIVQLGGGPKGLYARLKELADDEEIISEKAVYAWRQKGIPERHWQWVQRVCGVTAEQLHRANEALRANGRRRVVESKAA